MENNQEEEVKDQTFEAQSRSIQKPKKSWTDYRSSIQRKFNRAASKFVDFVSILLFNPLFSIFFLFNLQQWFDSFQQRLRIFISLLQGPYTGNEFCASLSLVNGCDKRFELPEEYPFNHVLSRPKFTFWAHQDHGDGNHDFSLKIHFFMIASKLAYEYRFVAQDIVEEEWGLKFFGTALPPQTENVHWKGKAIVFGEKDWVVVAFDGSQSKNFLELGNDFQKHRKSLNTEINDGEQEVHRGFYSALHNKGGTNKSPSIFEQLIDILGDKLLAVRNKDIYITGHSVGAALAVIFATSIFKRHDERECRQIYGRIKGVYTYGQPKIGNKSYLAVFSRGFGRYSDDAMKKDANPQNSGKESYRVIHGADLITELPLSLEFSHCVGQDVIFIDSQGNFNPPVAGDEWNLGGNKPEYVLKSSAIAQQDETKESLCDSPNENAQTVITDQPQNSFLSFSSQNEKTFALSLLFVAPIMAVRKVFTNPGSIGEPWKRTLLRFPGPHFYWLPLIGDHLPCDYERQLRANYEEQKKKVPRASSKGKIKD